MENLNKYIDHTILKRDVTTKEIDKTLNEAIEYKFATMCIAPA
jgi:deoxyribose-phosphate aldolase